MPQKVNEDKDEDEASNTAVVQIKIAPFDELNIDAWFKIQEAKLELHRITSDSSRFCHLMGNIPVSVLTKIPSSSTNDNSYKTLKKALLDTYSKSRPELFEQLLQSEKITCSQPSQTLNETSRIGQQVNANNELIRHQFLQSIPAHVRSQLVLYMDKVDSLAELGRSADMIKNYRANEKFGNAVQPQFPGANTYFNRSRNRQRGNNNNVFDRRDSTNDNNVFDRHVSNNTNRPSYSNPNIPFGVRAFSENQCPKTCRAHIYFGPAAKTCKPWCCVG